MDANNFLNFINEDIEAKKTLISTMPTRTKTNINKYNAKIDDILGKYKLYKQSVKKYLDVKAKSFKVKDLLPDNDKITDEIGELERARFILNPYNCYVEKMGFDNLLYEISHYYVYKFNSLNDIIDQFLKKFLLAGIALDKDDFKYTCYVHEYMSVFFEVKNHKNDDKLKDKFEHIYWVNPDIIEHIELNFRYLIITHERDFENHINKSRKELLSKLNINNYSECMTKLKKVYNVAASFDKENVGDIVELAKSNGIDISTYFKDSKIRIDTYNSLAIEPLDFNDNLVMNSFYDNLDKLYSNLMEYSGYLRFLPLIDDFMNEYKKEIDNVNKDKMASKIVSDLKKDIDLREKRLFKLNNKIINEKFGLFCSNKKELLKEARIESVRQAKELHEVYNNYENAYFKTILTRNISSSMTVSELLLLYYSYDYFKKIAIKRVFNIENYEELIKFSDDFDLFAMNPNNVILEGLLLFDDCNLAQIITNRYRLNNINLNGDTFDSTDPTPLLNKVNMLLRIKNIEDSSLTVEKIWFIAQVYKIDQREDKK